MGSSPKAGTILHSDEVVQIKLIGCTNTTLSLEIFFRYSKSGKIISEIPLEKIVTYKDKEGSSLKIVWINENMKYEVFVESFYSIADTLKEI